MGMECSSMADNLMMALLHDLFMLVGVLLMLAIAVPLYLHFRKRRTLP
jgi:type IV secretory pathway VirB3-like protein